MWTGLSPSMSDAPLVQSITKVKLLNLDLGNVVVSFLGDPMKVCPFDFCFRQGKNIETWVKVGFMHTGNAALDPKREWGLDKKAGRGFMAKY